MSTETALLTITAACLGALIVALVYLLMGGGE